MKVGIIGTGQAGRLHTMCYKNIPGTDVVAGMDIDNSKAIKWGDEHGIAKIYTDYLEMIHNEELDIVSICTFSPSHCEIVSRIIEQGIVKGIICEKPMAYTLAEADQMIELSNNTNIKLFVNIQRRFSDHHQRTKISIDNGDIGKLCEIYISMYEDFFDYGPHFLDIMRMYGGEVEAVLGQIGNIPNQKCGKGYYPAMPVIGTFKFKNGCYGFIETITQNGMFRLVGDKKEIILKLDDGTGGWEKAFNLMVNDITNNTNNSPSTALNGRKNLELILAVYESARQSREIFLPLELKREHPLDLMHDNKLAGINNQCKALIEVLEDEHFEAGEYSEAMEHFLKILFVFACNTKDCTVELGSGKFNSTMALGLGSQITGAEFFSIDMQDKKSEGEQKLCKYGINCKFIHSDSIIAGQEWDGRTIDLLYIDTSHTYEQTLGELETWWRFVKIGGFIILHDTSAYDDVSAAIWQFTKGKTDWIFFNIPICAGLGILWRIDNTHFESENVLDTGLNRLISSVHALTSVIKDIVIDAVVSSPMPEASFRQPLVSCQPINKGKILIGFDGIYVSQDGAYGSRGRYALYMAEALKSVGYTVHLYAMHYLWNYSTITQSTTSGKTDYDTYDRIIAFSDPDFKDYTDEMGEHFKNIDSEKLYLVTHTDRVFSLIDEIQWSHIITWEMSCADLLRNKGRIEEIDTWYPALKIVEEQEKNLVIATVRYAQDAHRTFKIFSTIHKDFDFKFYALAGQFLTQTSEGIDSYMMLQGSEFIDVLPKCPYPTFLKMLSKAVLYVEPTINAPIWTPAEAVMQKAMAIRPEGKDEYFIGKNLLSIQNLDDENELLSVVDKFKNITGEYLPLIDEIRQTFDFRKQQERLLEILHL